MPQIWNQRTQRICFEHVPRWSQDGPRPQEITGECYLRNTLPNAASSIFFVCAGASGMTQHAQKPFPSSSENSKQPKKVRQTQTSTFGAAYLGTVLIAEFKATTSAYKHNQLQGEHPHPPQSITKSQDQTQRENHKIFQVIGSDRGNKIQDIPSHSYQCLSSACRPSCRLRLSKAIAQSSICSSWIPMHTNAKVTSEPVACVSISEFPSPKIGGAACHRRVAVKLIIETLKNLAQQHDVHHRSLFTASGII